MSQKEFFENQVFEEILRERVNYYVSKNQVIDFWISLEPEFLTELLTSKNYQTTQFFKRTKGKVPYSCLISTNKEFINWIQLRLGFFENLENKTLPTNKEYYSDGLLLEITNAQEKNFESKTENIDPKILYPKYLLSRNFLKEIKNKK